MRNHQKHLVSLCAAIALCLIGWGARTEGKKAPIQIGAIHNLTGALGSIGAPSLDAWGCAARREPCAECEPTLAAPPMRAPRAERGGSAKAVRDHGTDLRR